MMMTVVVVAVEVEVVTTTRLSKVCACDALHDVYGEGRRKEESGGGAGRMVIPAHSVGRAIPYGGVS